MDYNPNLPLSIMVADDNGYAEHKICFWSGTPGDSDIVEMSFPSRAAMGSVAMSLDGEHNGVYKINDSLWTVSDQVSDPENTRAGDYATSELNCVLVNHALVYAKLGGKDVKIATGLPFEKYYDDEGIRKEYISKVKDSLKTPVVPLNDSVVMANITETKVYPESMAAWIDFSVDSKTGNVIAKNENGVAVVDIGGNTTDVTYINGGNRDINKSRSGTREIGVLHVRDKLRSLLKKEFTLTEIPDSKLDSALRTNNFMLWNKDNDVSELVKEAIHDVGQKVLNFVREKVGDGGQLDYIVFVGGGAELLRDVVKTFPHSQVPERPQFSNARGMLKHWTFVTG